MNWKSVIKVTLMVSVALLLVVMPFITGCAPAEEEEKVIKVSHYALMSGPVAAAGIPAGVAIWDYFGYMMEKEGGVGGIPVDMHTIDVVYDIPKGLSAFKTFADEGSVLNIGYQEKINLALVDAFAEAKLPNVSLTTGDAQIYPPGWIFCHAPTHADQFAGALDWFLRERWQKATPPVIAMMGADNPFGRAAEKGGTRYAKERGIEEVYYEWTSMVPMDVTPQLRKLEERGVDWVYLQTHTVTGSAIMRDAHRLGLTKKMTFMGFYGMVDPYVVKMAGADAMEGFLGMYGYGLLTEDLPGIRLLKDVFEWGGRSKDIFVSSYPWGFLSAMIAWEALERAVEQKGYPITGPDVYDAFLTFKDWDTGGLSSPITYTSEDRRGSPYMRVVEIRGGEFSPVTDWYEVPWIRPE